MTADTPTHSRNTHDAILAAALELFSRRGFEGTSMRDIAAEVGVTQGAIYKHFAGKEALLEAICALMEQADAEHTEDAGVPAEVPTDTARRGAMGTTGAQGIPADAASPGAMSEPQTQNVPTEASLRVEAGEEDATASRKPSMAAGADSTAMDAAQMQGTSPGVSMREKTGEEGNSTANEFSTTVAGSSRTESSPTRDAPALAAFRVFTLGMFSHWSADPLAAPFRRMLEIDRFRNRRMRELYRQYLGAGPLEYTQACLEDAGMPSEAARTTSLELWGAFRLLLDLVDAGETPLPRALEELDATLDGLLA